MRRKGFTLIEMLTVVVIIGILAAIAIPHFNNSKGRVYYTAMKSDLRNLASAQEAFFTDSMHYTSNVASLSYSSSNGVTPPVIVTVAGGWSATVSHSQLTGSECGIGVNATNPTKTAAGEGEPACK
jgi:type IV pilus assembly protein PilA